LMISKTADVQISTFSHDRSHHPNVNLPPPRQSNTGETGSLGYTDKILKIVPFERFFATSSEIFFVTRDEPASYRRGATDLRPRRW
jgi:hypothetical protein